MFTEFFEGLALFRRNPAFITAEAVTAVQNKLLRYNGNLATLLHLTLGSLYCIFINSDFSNDFKILLHCHLNCRTISEWTSKSDDEITRICLRCFNIESHDCMWKNRAHYGTVMQCIYQLVALHTEVNNKS